MVKVALFAPSFGLLVLPALRGLACMGLLGIAGAGWALLEFALAVLGFA